MKFKEFFKVMKIEIKQQLTAVKLIIAFIVAFIPLINPLASNSDDYQNIRQTWTYLGRVFSETITYAFFIRLSSVLVDRYSKDKNRVEYIVFPSITVFLAKSFVDLMLFIITILVSLVGAISIIYYLKNGKFGEYFFTNCLVFLLSINLWYLFVVSGLRLIVSHNKWKSNSKVILGTIFIFLTFVTYTALSILMGVVRVGDEYPVQNFFYNNKKWASFIPFVNFAYISMILYGINNISWYWLTPLMFQSILFFGLITKPLARNLKEFLTK